MDCPPLLCWGRPKRAKVTPSTRGDTFFICGAKPLAYGLVQVVVVVAVVAVVADVVVVMMTCFIFAK